MPECVCGIEKIKIEDLLESTRLVNAGVSHELRTPLQAIKSVLEVISEYISGAEADYCACRDTCPFSTYLSEITDNVQDALSSVNYSMSILSTLSDYAKSGLSNNADVIDVKKELSTIFSYLKIMEPFKALLPNQFSFNSGSETCLVRVNAVEFHQVLLNLCKNAVEAIDISREPRVVITLEVSNDLVSILVEDNGVGIPKENLIEIFKPYFSTKGLEKHNQGLGLPIVQSIVAKNSGAISCRSKQGFTEFKLQFPCMGGVKKGVEEWITT